MWKRFTGQQYIEIGHKCYYKREDVEVLLEKSRTEKYNDYGTRNRKQRNARDETTHLRH